MDMIDLMPPGLYEAVITGMDENVENPELVQGGYLFSLETRTLDDIRKLGGNSPVDDLAFATVARVSEINQGVYSTLMQPTVRAMATEKSAELMRHMHPNRLRFEMFADKNPFMQPVAAWADMMRGNRRPALRRTGGAISTERAVGSRVDHPRHDNRSPLIRVGESGSSLPRPPRR
jgi:hypothetical protein